MTASVDASGMKKRKCGGPSNLSAVCYILDKEAGMWTHVWQVDSRSFGSGQQRHRLYGSCFKKSQLFMPLEKARKVLSQAMSYLAGVDPCHPDEYLLPATSEIIQAEISMQLMKTLPTEDFLCQAEQAETLSISAMFRTSGRLPCALNSGSSKRRRLRAHPSDSDRQYSTSPKARWLQTHAEAFRDLGEDAGLTSH